MYLLQESRCYWKQVMEALRESISHIHKLIENGSVVILYKRLFVRALQSIDRAADVLDKERGDAVSKREKVSSVNVQCQTFFEKSLHDQETQTVDTIFFIDERSECESLTQSDSIQIKVKSEISKNQTEQKKGTTIANTKENIRTKRRVGKSGNSHKKLSSPVRKVITPPISLDSEEERHSPGGDAECVQDGPDDVGSSKLKTKEDENIFEMPLQPAPKKRKLFSPPRKPIDKLS